MTFNGSVDNDNDGPGTICCVVMQEWQKLHAERVVLES